MKNKMIRISQIRIPCGHPAGALEEKIRKILRTGGRPLRFSLVRHSVDARKKPELLDVYTVDVDTGMKQREETVLVRRLKNKNVTLAPGRIYRFPDSGREVMSDRPVVVGAGPAGLFCALFLAEHGYEPLLIERGRSMEERTADVEKYWETGRLDPLSNVQFGEGGAGTFSDGKLNTQINDRTGRSEEVLRIFVEAGAPGEILYESKPHIGTDRLRTVIPNLRRRIEEAGGEVRFGTVFAGLAFEEDSPGGGSSSRPAVTAGLSGARSHPAGEEPEDRAGLRRIKGIYVYSADDPGKNRSFLPAQTLVLAIGHSARDTVEALCGQDIPMEQKQFAVGFRVAHPQAMIDESQYGIGDPEDLAAMGLSASPYKLTARASSGRGVYSFCMCPGGYIVNASSEQGYLCVNGMSDEGRDSGWADSAIVVTVGEKEFGGSDVLAGMRFQRDLEKKAFLLGQGAVPVQPYEELRACFRGLHEKDAETFSDRSRPESSGAEAFPWARGLCRRAPLHELLPADLTRDFIEGMDEFGRKIRGFDGPSAIVAGVESRTSSPVRITRGETLESTGAAGLYPCGEGAGYAGGIMSAAMDGMRIAEAIARRFAPGDESGNSPEREALK